jgi:hypothetical protein
MTIAYLEQRILMIATACIVAGGCADDEPVLIRATATIENKLPVDGCSFVVRIDDTEYAPDADGRAAIIARGSPFEAVVEIKYRLTGKTGQIDCEPGKIDRPEISFVFVDLAARSLEVRSLARE